MLNKPVAPADITAVGRSLAFPVLLISLAVGGFLFVRQAQSDRPAERPAPSRSTLTM